MNNNAVKKQIQQSNTLLSTESQQSTEVALLPTALVTAFSSNGTQHTLRALIDPGSMSTFINEATVQLLGLRKIPVSVPITGIAESRAPTVKHKVKLQLHSQVVDFILNIDNALILRTLNNFMPSQQINLPKHFFNGLELADPSFGVPGKIDILLGTGAHSRILINDVKQLSILMEQFCKIQH